MDAARPYAPPQAWPRPGAVHLGWIAATPTDEPAPTGPDQAEAAWFETDPAVAWHESAERRPPDPRTARRPGAHEWVRAGDLIQRQAATLADRLSAPAHRAGEKLHEPVAVLTQKVKDAMAARRAQVAIDPEPVAPAPTSGQGIYR